MSARHDAYDGGILGVDSIGVSPGLGAEEEIGLLPSVESGVDLGVVSTSIEI